MATKISEDTNVQLDLKTIAMIVGGAVISCKYVVHITRRNICFTK